MDIGATKIIIPPNSAREVIGILADHGIYWCGDCTYPLNDTAHAAANRADDNGNVTIRFDSMQQGASYYFYFGNRCDYTEISVNKLIEILKQ